MKAKWILVAAIGLLVWPGLWRIEVTDSAVVRFNRLTGAIAIIPIAPSFAEAENGSTVDDDGDTDDGDDCTCGYPGDSSELPAEPGETLPGLVRI
ncbi:MAG: hypothetical protein ABSH32_26185 [Bryobacteraceae bacterium]|jgi:hypothetical protein